MLFQSLLRFSRFPGSRAGRSRRRDSRDYKVRRGFEPLEGRWLLSGVTLEVLGTHQTGIFDGSAAEVLAYDDVSQRLFVTNVADNRLDVLDISDPTTPTALTPIDLSAFGVEATSVQVHDGLVAVSVFPEVITAPATVAFFHTDGEFLSSVQVRAHPDPITFTPDGTKVLVANEGTPDYAPGSIDPEGSVSIISIPEDVTTLDQSHVTTASFQAFNGREEELRAEGVRIFGPGATVAQDLEPEYIAVSADSTTAWVALQENNAIAELDIATATFTAIRGLGYKDHLLAGNGLDPSDKDGPLDGDVDEDRDVDFQDFQIVQANFGTSEGAERGDGDLDGDGDVDFADFQLVQVNFGQKNANTGTIQIGSWPVKGMYQPDGMAVYEAGGQQYLITANEGDSRDYVAEIGGEEVTYYSEEARVGKLTLAPELLAAYPDLQEKWELGRLKVTTAFPATVSEDGVVHDLYCFGTRSFSIWTTGGELVFDSGDDFEQITADRYPENFNATNKKNNFDNRSDDKGPEPEYVVVAEIEGSRYAFIGLERMGGIMIYDVSDPHHPVFQDYVNNRDFSGSPTEGTAGDLAPEGIKFIPAAESPNGHPLLVTANEVSGTTTVFQVNLSGKNPISDARFLSPGGRGGHLRPSRSTVVTPGIAWMHAVDAALEEYAERTEPQRIVGRASSVDMFRLLAP